MVTFPLVLLLNYMLLKIISIHIYKHIYAHINHIYIYIYGIRELFVLFDLVIYYLGIILKHILFT